MRAVFEYISDTEKSTSMKHQLKVILYQDIIHSLIKVEV